VFHNLSVKQFNHRMIAQGLSALSVCAILSYPQTSVAQEASEAPEQSEGARPPEERVKARADRLSHDRGRGITVFRGNVRVERGAVSIQTDELNVDQRQKSLTTNTPFTLTQPDAKKPDRKQVITGTALHYNYETREGDIEGANLSVPAEQTGQTIHVRAKRLKAFGDKRFDAENAVFSTCEEVNDGRVPHYHVEARSLQYFPGDRVVAWDSRVYLNGRYAFWLPVAVIPLKNDREKPNIGRSEVEGFFIRSSFDYQLPTLNNGYWLNSGKTFLNVFEKKGVGLGFEHQATWGYEAATYAFLYGLVTPDETNLLPVEQTLSPEDRAQRLKSGAALLGLYGGPFQDRQFGIEHKQRLFGRMELSARLEDHNIYDPLSPNFRNNRDSLSLSLKDRIDSWGGLNYDLGFDRTNQRGNQAVGTSLSQSLSDRVRANAGFKLGNTDVRLSSQMDRAQQVTRSIVTPTNTGNAEAGAQPAASPADAVSVKVAPGAANINVTNNLNFSSNWGPNTTSTLQVPYRIAIKEAAPLDPTQAPSTTPVPTPAPWDQQAEPQFDWSHRMQGMGSVGIQAQKFLDLTRYPQDPNQTAAQQLASVRQIGRFDKLPEITWTSEPFLANWQPLNAKIAYGRFFEYATFRPLALQSTPYNRLFPGDFINRFNPEFSLASKLHPIGFSSKLDFGGTGYRQFVYSTRDAQYTIDQRVRLLTDWAEGVQTNLNYVNNQTPDPDEMAAAGREKEVNNSPFNQDRLALSKQTRLTGTLDVRRDPFFTYAFRSGYDYQNKLFDNISSELTWRSRMGPWPFGVTLNGQFDIEEEGDTGRLKFVSKAFNWGGLPEFRLPGIGGKFLPLSGTFTLRSTPEIFGGAYGSDTIKPGWQLDSSLAYDLDKNQWQTLINRVYITLGNDWRSHMQLVLGGYYDTGEKQYRFSQIGINKDLHDFVLSMQYDRLASFYSISLTMVAFPGNPLSFTSNTFDRRTGAGGGAAFPGL